MWKVSSAAGIKQMLLTPCECHLERLHVVHVLFFVFFVVFKGVRTVDVDMIDCESINHVEPVTQLYR